MKADITKDKSMFKTISDKDFTSSRAKLRMKINKIEKEIDFYIVRNANFTYDFILGLDAIEEVQIKTRQDLESRSKSR
jgi:hypothetical protein